MMIVDPEPERPKLPPLEQELSGLKSTARLLSSTIFEHQVSSLFTLRREIIHTVLKFSQNQAEDFHRALIAWHRSHFIAQNCIAKRSFTENSWDPIQCFNDRDVFSGMDFYNFPEAVEELAKMDPNSFSLALDVVLQHVLYSVTGSSNRGFLPSGPNYNRATALMIQKDWDFMAYKMAGEWWERSMAPELNSSQEHLVQERISYVIPLIASLRAVRLKGLHSHFLLPKTMTFMADKIRPFMF